MRPQEVAERALAASRTDGCVVLVQEQSVANLRWAGNTLTTNGVARSRELSVLAVRGRQLGSATRAVAIGDTAAIEDTVRAAEASAAAMPAEDDAAPLITPDAAPPSAWEEPAPATGIDVFAALAGGLADAFGSARAAGHGLYGYAEHELVTTYLASSTGLRLRHAEPAGRFELTARADGGARSAWLGTASADFADVDPIAAAADLAQRLDWARRSAPAEPGRVPVLLSPSAVADLMVDLYWSAGGQDAAEGRTAFSHPGGGTRVGERLSSLPLTLLSDPALPGQECAPFLATAASSRVASAFDNGLALGRTEWVNDGVLSALQTTRRSAELTGLPVCPFVDNLRLQSGAGGRSLAEMVAATDDALLVTCLWYIREVDPQTMLLTGLTRDGVYRVRDGEVVGATTNFRFNESPLSLLGRASEVGATQRTLGREFADYFPRTEMPALRVPDFHLSSVSPAS